VVPCEDLFSTMPLEAVKKLIFDAGGYDLDFVLSRMEPTQDYKQEEIDTGIYKEIQDKTFRVSSNSKEREGLLVDVLRDKCKDNSEFIRDFVWFVTGSHYIRHSDFKILVEFNSSEDLDEETLPTVHTCVNTIKFPVLVYNNDREVLEQKLDLAIANSKECSFDMI
jgi:HECT-domain (ubiquitin-transferase)